VRARVRAEGVSVEDEWGQNHIDCFRHGVGDSDRGFHCDVFPAARGLRLDGAGGNVVGGCDAPLNRLSAARMLTSLLRISMFLSE
jgi:hypothetical protein